MNRNVVAGRGRTSMRLEPEVWDALSEICLRESVNLGALIRSIEQAGHEGGRTSAVRVYVLQYFRAAATEAGHEAAGHGAAGVGRRQRGGHSEAGPAGSLVPV
jgi:predicted DNA-binding ribbon-helix-helix protein